MADFLDQGFVENIAAMYRKDPIYYTWTGELLDDERFAVRLGISVLFEELQEQQPDKTVLAIPSLVEKLQSEWELLRGEAISVLAIIGTEEAMDHIRKMENDPHPQVRELVQDILSDQS